MEAHPHLQAQPRLPVPAQPQSQATGSSLSIRETADGLTKKMPALDGITETLERSRSQDKRERYDVMKLMKAFKKTLGKGFDGENSAWSFGCGELLERAGDPEANRQ